MKSKSTKNHLEKIIVSILIGVAVCFAFAPASSANQPEEVSLSQSIKSKLLDNVKRIPNERRIAQQTFRKWANEPKPFGATLLLCIFISSISLGFFPKATKEAVACVKSSFWSCLGRAILTNICLIILFRVFITSKATMPISFMMIGILELLLLIGLSISIYLIGERITNRIGLNKLEILSSRHRVRTFISIFVGSILIALIVQIPELGKFPPIGVRLATLIAALGEGGILISLLAKQKLSD